MRLVNPEDPLVSNSDLIEDALKVLAEIEGPTESLRELLEELQDCPSWEFHLDHVGDALVTLDDLEAFFETEEENIRGFSRDLNYISTILVELEARASNEYYGGKLRKPAFFAFGEQPPAQEMDN